MKYCTCHSISTPNSGASAVFEKEKAWKNGTNIKIRFLNGSTMEHEKVIFWAKEWCEYANITFDFSQDLDSEIRITFDKGRGSWSAVGIDALNQEYFPPNTPTMNFGWELDRGTVLHEFGHLLGLGHEHQNPKGGIQWNERIVFEEVSKSQGWNRAKIIHNIIRRYSLDQIKGTEFDPDSIMLYFFPTEWTLNGLGTNQNDVLSRIDKEFISAIYPSK